MFSYETISINASRENPRQHLAANFAGDCTLIYFQPIRQEIELPPRRSTRRNLELRNTETCGKYRRDINQDLPDTFFFSSLFHIRYPRRRSINVAVRLAKSHRNTSFLRQSKERDLMLAKRIADRGWRAPLIVGHQRGCLVFSHTRSIRKYPRKFYAPESRNI